MNIGDMVVIQHMGFENRWEYIGNFLAPDSTVLRWLRLNNCTVAARMDVMMTDEQIFGPPDHPIGTIVLAKQPG